MGSLFKRSPEAEIAEALARKDWNRFKAVIKKHPELVNIKFDGNATPLHAVLSSGRTDAIEILISSNADINARDNLGRTPLHLALLDGHVEAAKLLILNNADLKAKDRDGGTPLELASFLGHKEIANLIRTVTKKDRQEII